MNDIEKMTTAVEVAAIEPTQPKLSRQVRRELERAQKKEKTSNAKARKRAELATRQLHWEELGDLYNTCLAMLAQGTNLEPLLLEAMPWVTDKQYLETTLNQVADDVVQLSQELTTIYNSHKDLKGQVDVETVMDYFNFSTAYQTWTMRYESVALPGVNALIDIHYTAMVEKAKQEGIDISTVAKLPKIESFIN